MSIELPEAFVLAKQMNKGLRGKQITSCHFHDYEKAQKTGLINKDLGDFDKLVGGSIEAVTSKGSVVRVKLDNGMNLAIAPEYGGRFFYHTNKAELPEKLLLSLAFLDGALLSCRLTGWGMVYAAEDNELGQLYVYKREHSGVLSPLDDEFTLERFSNLLGEQRRQIKSVLVGKDAVLIGLANSAFQDIIYRARIHPKRRASDLDEHEKRALYDAVTIVVKERIRLGGKDQFLDLYGKQGGYTPAMGPNMKLATCSECGAPIEKMSVGGGHVYFCPKCQK